MNTVFVAIPGRSGLPEVIEKCRASGLSAEPAGSDRWRIGSPSEHVWLFEEEQAGEVPVSLRGALSPPPEQRDRSVLVFEYSSLPLTKRLIELLAQDQRTVVDNDHGTSLSGPEFIRKLSENPTWDWRLGTD